MDGEGWGMGVEGWGGGMGWRDGCGEMEVEGRVWRDEMWSEGGWYGVWRMDVENGIR